MTTRNGESKQGGERRQGTREAAERLLAERQQVLVSFERLAGVAPYGGKKTDAKAVQDFCELLIDYVAAGHFALYRRINEGTERRRNVARVAEQVYPTISDTTQAVLDFNDKYDGQDGEAMDELPEELSRLGEQLATRVELEDQLIGELLSDS